MTKTKKLREDIEDEGPFCPCCGCHIEGDGNDVYDIVSDYFDDNVEWNGNINRDCAISDIMSWMTHDEGPVCDDCIETIIDEANDAWEGHVKDDYAGEEQFDEAKKPTKKAIRERCFVMGPCANTESYGEEGEGGLNDFDAATSWAKKYFESKNNAGKKCIR